MHRRHALLFHVALDIFHHHDCIITHDTDGQHQAEKGEQVDRETQRHHTNESSDYRYQYGNGGNHRGADTLQEQVGHQHHQDNRHDQGFGHFIDGSLYKLGGIQ